MTTTTTIVQRAEGRFETRTDWLDSKHSFSFGRHYDVSNTHFGLLLVNNDDIVTPGAGFETHPHRDMEIVTWVLRGQLVHQDSEGHNGVIYPGLAQRMSAGRGIMHSEKNDSWRLTGGPEHDEPVRFVQMWVVPDEPRLDPGYEQLEIADDLLSGGLVPVASGHAEHKDQAAIRIKQKNATLHAARLAPAAVATLPTAPFVHLYVPVGSVTLEGTVIHEGTVTHEGAVPLEGAVTHEGAVTLEGAVPLESAVTLESAHAGQAPRLTADLSADLSAELAPERSAELTAGDAARIENAEGQRVTAGPFGAEILVWEMHANLR